MAISLGSISGGVTSAINGITSSFNTLTTNTFSNSSNFPNGVNAVSRNLSQNGTANPNANPLAAIGGLSNQLLGNFNPVSKLLNQGGAALGAINKLSSLGSAASLGGLLGGQSKPPSVQSLIAGKLKSSNLGSFAATIESLGSIGSTVAKSNIGPFNSVTVVNRSSADLSGVALIQRARTFMESYKPEVGQGSAKTDGITNYVKTSEGRILNPLRDSNSNNYIITLGILDADQINNPSSYRTADGFKKVLLKSGGGLRSSGYAKRIRTFSEGEEDAEYFIEDLEVSAVICPNPNTSTALGTNVTFKIIEPYSMGKIIEAMMIGSQECGFSSYLEAPFCIKIEFLGWDENGEKDAYITPPAYIPIRINKMDLNIGQQGSTYQCTAVPFNESALSDVANKTKVATSAYGDTVHAILETSKESVTYTVNGQIETLEDKKVIKGYDRYLICFPKTQQDLIKAIESKTVDTSTLKATQDADDQERRRRGVGEPVRNPNPNAAAASVPVISTAPNTYLFLKAWAENTANMNDFGLSPVVVDTRAGGDQSHGRAGAVINQETSTIQRDSPSNAPSEKSRKFNFTEGAKITDIITEVLMSSSYVQEQAAAPSQNGFKKHFRIETMVFVEPDEGGIQAQIGRPRKTYVYAVHPYWTYEARQLAPGQTPANVTQVKDQAKKEYNYYYTGQNEDVLDFDINFNLAFFQNIRSDIGQNSATSISQENTSTGPRPSTVIASSGDTPAPASNNGEAVPGVEYTASNRSVSSGGTRIGTVDQSVKRAIAEEFHNRLINSPADMVTAEMTIWGDPYYIPSSVGNYSPAPGEPTVTADGTMSYMRDEVFVVINFLTPLDYFMNGSTMDFPTYVRPFSGLYQVVTATSTFSAGTFKQLLKVIRVPGQNGEPGTVNNSGVLQTGTRENVTVPDVAQNINPNPEQAPLAAPTSADVDRTLTGIQNLNIDEGSAASFSQNRLMTSDTPTSPSQVITNPLSSIASVIPAEELANLPIDSASRLGITANLTSTVFPLKLPNNFSSSLPSLAAVNASNLSNTLQRSGLNIPANGSLPFNLPSAPNLPPLPGIGGSLTAAAGALTSNETIGRIQTSVNSLASGLSTQARAVGLRPPTG
jgi:hypothetical protein